MFMFSLYISLTGLCIIVEICPSKGNLHVSVRHSRMLVGHHINTLACDFTVQSKPVWWQICVKLCQKVCFTTQKANRKRRFLLIPFSCLFVFFPVHIFLRVWPFKHLNFPWLCLSPGYLPTELNVQNQHLGEEVFSKPSEPSGFNFLLKDSPWSSQPLCALEIMLMTFYMPFKSVLHVNVWKKPLQYCKVISLQLIKINGKNKIKQNKTWKKKKWFAEDYPIWHKARQGSLFSIM